MQYDQQLTKKESISPDKNRNQSVSRAQNFTNSNFRENAPTKTFKKSGAKLSNFQFTP